MVPSLRLCTLRLRFHGYRAFSIDSLKANGVENGKGDGFFKTIRSHAFQGNTTVFERTCFSEYKRGFKSVKFYSVDDNKSVEDEDKKELDDDDAEKNVQDEKEILIGEAEKDSKDGATISAVVGVETVVVVPDPFMKKKKIPKWRRNLCKCHFRPCHFSGCTYSPPPPQPAPPSPPALTKMLPSKQSIGTLFTWCTNLATVAALTQFYVRVSDVISSANANVTEETSKEEMPLYKKVVMGTDSKKLEEIHMILNEINKNIDLQKNVSSSGLGTENGDDKEDDGGSDAGGANII